MTDSQRHLDIVKAVLETKPGSSIRFHGLNRGLNFVPKGFEPSLPVVQVFDLTLMDIGGEPTVAELLYFEVDGEKFFIDENTISPPTIPPTSEAVLTAREIHGIVVQ